jgi:hypothetical protein
MTLSKYFKFLNLFNGEIVYLSLYLMIKYNMFHFILLEKLIMTILIYSLMKNLYFYICTNETIFEKI